MVRTGNNDNFACVPNHTEEKNPCCGARRAFDRIQEMHAWPRTRDRRSSDLLLLGWFVLQFLSFSCSHANQPDHRLVAIGKQAGEEENTQTGHTQVQET